MTEEEARRRERAKSVRPLAGLFPMLMQHKMKVWLAVLALIAAATASLAIPLAVREVIDGGFISAENGGTIGFDVFVISAVIALFLAISSALRFYFVTILGERLGADLRTKVFSHILSLEPSFFEKIRTGEVITRLSADAVLIRTILVSSASIALRNVLLLAGASAMLIITSPSLSALVLVVIPLLCLPLLGFGRIVRRLSRHAQDRLADTGAMASELLGAIQTVQSFTYENTARERFNAAAEIAFLSARRRVAARAMLVALVISVVFLAILAVFYQGGLALIAGEMTAGQLTQFVIYAIMVGGSVAALGEVWGDLQLAAGAAERLFELLAQRARITQVEHPVELPEPAHGQISGEISFENVSFSYPSRPDIDVLNNFSLHIPAGQIMALVGLSGVGKSTVFHLLNRFDDPQSGHITFDKIDLRECSLDLLRQKMASVLQEPVLFSMSIADNILYARSDASMDEVVEAAKKAAAHQFIMELPQGYDTIAGERGVMLSGGQRQRIAIARALLRNAPVLLLDEATSALDSENEDIVQQALGGIANQCTALIIAHRLTTVQRADNIAVMENGRISAQGTHEDLLQKSELYRRLARQRFAAAPETPEKGTPEKRSVA